MYLSTFHRNWFILRMQSGVNLTDYLPILTDHPCSTFNIYSNKTWILYIIKSIKNFKDLLCNLLSYKAGWVQKNWCFWTVVLEKTLESPLDRKEIQPVHPRGNRSWVFIGRTDVEAGTPVFWPPDAKSWLIWKDPDARRDWRQEEKGMTEDEMVGCQHWLNGREFE